jgi:hypothetical protein
MRKITFFLLSLIALQAAAQKAVFIIADGIPADVIERMAMPNLKRISDIGIYCRAHVGGDKGEYSQTPTISAVSYNSLLTGTWVNKHNVWGNNIKAPNYHYPTIFQLFKEQYPNKKIGVFSSWLDNRTKLVGEGLAATHSLKVDYTADGYELDTLHFPHDKAGDYMHQIDEKVITEASACIKNNAPDLSWIYLEYTDDIGHKYGDSPEQQDALAKLDKQIGRVWEAITYREKNYKEKWMIIITTDHGRDEISGKGHGGQTPRQRNTWMVSNKKFNRYAEMNVPGIVDIMPTLASFLQVKLPETIAKEVDGISLIGKISIAQPMLNIFQQKADISWQVLDTSGIVKIWLSNSNNFQTEGNENYRWLQEVPVKFGHATFDISNFPGDFYKVAIEAKFNTVNRWWVKEKTK